VRFELEDLKAVDWAALDAFEDRTFAQRRAWLAFVSRTQAGEPVVASLRDGTETLGYFTGVVVRKLGLRILGSPFPGWSTPFMGFNLSPDVPRAEAVAALIPFAFGDLQCHHLEVEDPYLTPDQLPGQRFEVSTRTFRSDLERSEEALFGAMDSACRRCIRKAEKVGVRIEEAAPDGFAAEYFAQLKDVFAKQNLTPTYGVDRVEALIETVHGTGDLLLLRARDPEGRSIATGIFPGFNRISHFWGNGSLREHQIHRPNEAIHWHAMRTWKKRGIRWHYWGGGGDYKRKYGGEELTTYRLRLSRNAFVDVARTLAKKAYYFPRMVKRNRYLRSIG
jgi:hypothetical protein